MSFVGGLGLVGLCCALFCQYSAARASQGFGSSLRRALYRKINSLSHTELDQLGTTSLINRLTGDINQLQTAVAMMIRLVIRAPFLVIGSTVMAIYIDLKLSVIFLIASPLIAFILYLIMSRSIPFYRTIQKKLDRIGLITDENLAGVRVIRAFSRQSAEQDRFEQANEDYRRTSMQVGRISALLSPLTFVVVNLAIVAIIRFGAVQVKIGALTQGQIVALVNYMNQILLALVVVANLVVIFTRAAASATRVSEVLALEPSIQNPQRKMPAEDSDAPRISFESVRLRYAGAGEDTLNDISFSAQPGQTIGIIGGTGSGKTSLISLIPRFYDPSEGRILMNGVDLLDWPLDKLRGRIGLVPPARGAFLGDHSGKSLLGRGAGIG